MVGIRNFYNRAERLGRVNSWELQKVIQEAKKSASGNRKKILESFHFLVFELGTEGVLDFEEGDEKVGIAMLRWLLDDLEKERGSDKKDDFGVWGAYLKGKIGDGNTKPKGGYTGEHKYGQVTAEQMEDFKALCCEYDCPDWLFEKIDFTNKAYYPRV